MYGVVLWSDSKRNRAVIWCEDHRNLAFFNEEDDTATSREGFEPGDLVAFDLREENDLRLAVDPYVVAPHEFPSLAMDLKSAFEGLEREQLDPPAKPARAPAGQGGRVVSLFRNAEPPLPVLRPPVRSCG
ncbi:hypothetical protein [Roseovarius salis]|uniref:hypothetical protein n=1 Tax=Roseovarius salis TaxID=3376063 RepID=UPI0037CCAE52